MVLGVVPANSTGSYNTYLGYQTQASGGPWSNSTAIGAGATITASNQIVLGTASETVKIPGALQSAIPQIWHITKNLLDTTVDTGTNYFVNVSVYTTQGGASSSCWNSTTGIFTANTDGLYHIQLQLFINNTSGAAIVSKRFCQILGTAYNNYTGTDTGTLFMLIIKITIKTN